jgi:hypothetical protein
MDSNDVSIDINKIQVSIGSFNFSEVLDTKTSSTFSISKSFGYEDLGLRQGKTKKENVTLIINYALNNRTFKQTLLVNEVTFIAGSDEPRHGPLTYANETSPFIGMNLVIRTAENRTLFVLFKSTEKSPTHFFYYNNEFIIWPDDGSLPVAPYRDMDKLYIISQGFLGVPSPLVGTVSVSSPMRIETNGGVNKYNVYFDNTGSSNNPSFPSGKTKDGKELGKLNLTIEINIAAFDNQIDSDAWQINFV